MDRFLNLNKSNLYKTTILEMIENISTYTKRYQDIIKKVQLTTGITMLTANTCIAGKWGLTEKQSAANRYCTASRLDGILFGG